MLYEPTNVTPSVITQTGTIAAAENVNIQWQVNGNSAMMMFQIDVYTDDAESNLVYSTGLVTQTPQPPTGAQQTYTPLPFYGKDKFGNYITFVYYPAFDWGAGGNNSSNWGLQDGNNYKFVITQFYQSAANTFAISPNDNLTYPNTYYFDYTFGGTKYYVSFAIPSVTTYPSGAGTTIYYSHTNQYGWIRGQNNNQRVELNITFARTTQQPTSGINLNSASALTTGIFYNVFFTTQNTPYAIIARTAPTLTIDSFTNPVASSIQNFTATYTQAQDDAVSFVQWQLFNSTDLTTPIDNTGEIITGVLSYQYDGLFNGQTYQVVCTVITSNNVEITASQTFTVNYSQQTYTGGFNITPLCYDNSNYLQWDALSIIPGESNPVSGYSIVNGILSLNNNATITWDSASNNEGQLQPLNLSTPWTVVWAGEISQESTQYNEDLIQNVTAYNNEVNVVVYNSNGTQLAVGGNFKHYSALYNVDGDTYSYADFFYRSGSSGSINSYVNCCVFSPSGNIAVIGGNFYGYAAIFNPAAAFGFRYIADIKKENNILDYTVLCCAFNPSGTLLVLGYVPVGAADLFSVSGTTVTYEKNIGGETYPYLRRVLSCAFNPSGSLLILCGRSDEGYASVYNVSGTTITHIGPVTKNGANLNNIARSCAFNTDGSLLVLGGSFSGYASIFSVSGTTVTYIGDITKNGVALDGQVSACAFNADGSLLVLGGSFSGYASIFSVSGTTVTYIGDITKNGVPLNDTVRSCSWSPDGNTFVLGGQFDGYIAPWTYEAATNETFFTIQSQNITIKRNEQSIQAVNGSGSVLASVGLSSPLEQVNRIVIAMTSTSLLAYEFSDGIYKDVNSAVLNYSQQNISSLQITGPQTCDYVGVFGGDIISNLQNPDFVPTWSANTYTVKLLSNFLYGLDGGTGTSSGNGFYVFRRLEGQTAGTAIATLSGQVTQLKDYSIKSGESYIYDFYVYDANGAFMGVKSNADSPVSQCFDKFSLLSTTYNQSDGCYHVIKEYQFSCNIQDMTISNNSNKTYAQNFTPYPTVFKSTANYASGTLQALIGFVDRKSYQYWDSAALMDELNSLSTTQNTLFLRDMKGHLWMIDVGTVQQTATQKTLQMQVTISLPWTEIGSAEGVSIIQTPEDAGWNNGAEVLDVTLSVNVTTGQLEVVYPYPYYGTTFALDPTGVELIAQTPIDVTPPAFNLPTVAQSPTDGQLSATVTLQDNSAEEE